MFNAWVEEAVAPAIPASLKLYKRLIKLGIKIVFLTGSGEAYRKLYKKSYGRWLYYLGETHP